jgi:exopolyphosphatase/guanosine-5'-triphosphate,3'-diphosphate pyrophosphatase
MRLAAIDLGSNSFHLLVAEVRPDGSFEPVFRDKEMLRLGTRVAATGSIGEAATGEAIAVIRRFKSLADSLGASEIVACATAALREALDSTMVVDRIEADTGVRVRVINGREEARLIFEAVRTSVVIEPGPALALDLGGGSLELMIGDHGGMAWCASLKLGVARLTSDLVRSDPPSSGDRRRVTRAVSAAVGRLLPDIAAFAPRDAIASSGTFAAIIRLAAGRRGGPVPESVNQLAVSGREIDDLAEQLLSQSAAERAALPGVDAYRADLLPAGVLVLATLIELTGVERVIGCDWALREGMVIDAIGHHPRADWGDDPRAIRRESVLSLCRRCGWNESHGRKVARLALELFDGTTALHGLGEDDRELLELGALAHDVGEHVSVEGHDRHSAYLIQHGRLRGFSPEEIDILACLGRFHRRGNPKMSFEQFAGLSPARRQATTALISLLQVADGLDRSHGGPVRSVAVYSASPERVEVVVEAGDDIDVELWGLRRKRELFERLFERRLEVVSGQLELPIADDSNSAWPSLPGPSLSR